MEKEGRNMGYLLSIIIPTKNRYNYLSKTLVNLSNLDEKKVEIVVQDNTDAEDNSKIKELIKSLNNNIKYYHCLDDLSQTGNSDLAVSHASGEYCCYIGDDDTVLPDIVDVVEYLRENCYEACICDQARFYWPDVVFEKKRAWLKYNNKKYKTYILESMKSLNKSMSYGMQDIDMLPRVYHGIVSRKVLEKIQHITGTFFPGPSPDMANAVACSLIVEKYVYTQLPFIFSGVGFSSGAGMGQRGAHKGSLRDAKQLPKNAEKEWSKRIPKIWLGYTVWTESAEKAMSAMGREEMIENINIKAMEAKIFLKYPEYRDVIIERLKNRRDMAKLIFECIRFALRYIYEQGKIKYRVCRGLIVNVNKSLAFDDAYNLVRRSNLLMEKEE